jgi:nucleoside-diphosphate-sugar epimerase
MVFVTGGTGFLGSYIIRELVQKGYDVKAIKRETSRIPFYISPDIFKKVTWVNGDIMDILSLEEAMQDVDTVIHAAAIVSFDRSDKKKILRVNIEGTANVVNMALEKNISRFVHISSVAALGRKKSGDHVNEEKKWEENKMNTHYAISKYRAEMEIWRAMGEGLNAVIVNPSILLGYGDWNETSCRMFKSFYHEFPWYTTGINGFADVEDAAKAIVLLMETAISEERFIINNDNWSFQKLFTAIAEGFEKKPPSRNVPPFLSGLAWRSEKIKSFFTGQKPLLTKESARLAHSNTWFENEKILNALPGFTFTPLQETIRTACKKYLMQP